MGELVGTGGPSVHLLHLGGVVARGLQIPWQAESILCCCLLAAAFQVSTPVHFHPTTFVSETMRTPLFSTFAAISLFAAAPSFAIASVPAHYNYRYGND